MQPTSIKRILNIYVIAFRDRTSHFYKQYKPLLGLPCVLPEPPLSTLASARVPEGPGVLRGSLEGGVGGGPIREGRVGV